MYFLNYLWQKIYFLTKYFFKKNLTPSHFDTNLCCGYVTSRGFHHDFAFIKYLILRRMPHIVCTNNTEAIRNIQTWAGNLLSLPRSYLYLFSLAYYLSRDARKPVFRVSDQVRHKPACTSSEKS